jgi:GT2 family glycosyltransferase
MQKGKVSIIIVNWNGGEILYNCIKSIRENSNNNNYEIIVVDNNSSDNSIEMVEMNFRDTKIVRNSANEGFAKANNIGLLYAEGEYILLLNSDTLFLDDNISIAIDFMNKHKEISMLGVKLLNSDLTLQKSCFKLPSLTSYFFEYVLRYRYTQKYDYDVEHSVECISGAYMFIRRTAVEKLGLFDEQYYFYQEDTDLCKKFWDNNETLYYIPYSKVIHIGGSSTTSVKAKMLIQMHKNRYIYIDKYFSNSKKRLFDLITKLGLVSDFFASSIKLFLKRITNKDFLDRIKTYKKIFLLGRSYR